MRFQIIYKATLDLEDFRKNLEDLGYRPEIIPSSRNEEIYTDNFRFELLPNVSVLVFPKEKFCFIQVTWNSVNEMKKNESKLMRLFGSEHTSTLGEERLVINLNVLHDDDFLSELEESYTKYMKKAKAREKLSKKYESLLDDFFY
jgi:hypothetical protein